VQKTQQVFLQVLLQEWHFPQRQVEAQQQTRQELERQQNWPRPHHHQCLPRVVEEQVLLQEWQQQNLERHQSCSSRYHHQYSLLIEVQQEQQVLLQEWRFLHRQVEAQQQAQQDWQQQHLEHCQNCSSCYHHRHLQLILK